MASQYFTTMFYFLGLGGALGLFAFYVATRPTAFRLARSLTIDAPASVLFALVNDFHQWGAWSPWEKHDPDLKKTFEGSEAGKGAVYRWAGNNKVGEGSATITESTPDSRIEVLLNFIKPFAATNKAIYSFEPDGQGTRVTWAMEGENSFMTKAFRVFVDMDKMLSSQFDAGLANLRDVATKQAS